MSLCIIALIHRTLPLFMSAIKADPQLNGHFPFDEFARHPRAFDQVQPVSVKVNNYRWNYPRVICWNKDGPLAIQKDHLINDYH